MYGLWFFWSRFWMERNLPFRNIDQVARRLLPELSTRGLRAARNRCMVKAAYRGSDTAICVARMARQVRSVEAAQTLGRFKDAASLPYRHHQKIPLIYKLGRRRPYNFGALPNTSRILEKPGKEIGKKAGDKLPPRTR